MQDDDQLHELRRRRKVENFRLNIEDDTIGQPQEEDNTLQSFSDPRARQRAKQQELQASDRAERAHQWRNKEKGRKNRFFFRMIWLVMVLLTSTLLARFAINGINDMLAVGREKVTLTVEIPKNANGKQVADILERAGVIRNPDFFQLYSKLTKAEGHYNNGSFQLDTSMDYQALIYTLQSNLNRVDTVKLTFKEGANALEIADQLEKGGVCTAKDFLAALNTTDFDSKFEIIQQITNPKDRYYKLEGYLFPDTYEFYKDEKPEAVIRKMLNNCNKKLTQEIRNSASAQKLTVDQLLTLASMIQAEAADKEDMYNISSVFHNRLASGGKGDLTRLRSDPTTYYPYRSKAAVPSNIRDTYKSRYDTYTIQGLPPGPICNPGTEAIGAALNPAKTSYYYFCHDAKGKAYYAKTNAQHEANLKKAGLK
ncbi:endolytic transglycosylase MltG [Caproiciproducens sp. LBM24188]|nr:endolytic transglycosylase MltG [Oscillospiraceae bacterium]HHV32932.1 endolytic transglycosylase MltG [Clostridiales bacterium]